MINHWAEFSEWSANNGLNVDEEEVILKKDNLRFCFWNDGEVWVKKVNSDCDVRFTLAKNRNIEELKKMIEALM